MFRIKTTPHTTRHEVVRIPERIYNNIIDLEVLTDSANIWERILLPCLDLLLPHMAISFFSNDDNFLF